MTTSAGDSLSQPEYEVRLLYDQRVPMRDGITLSADVYLPRADGPFPTILHRTPYESSLAKFIDQAVFWARRGYAVVNQDHRGKFESGGEFYAYVDEGPDGFDTLGWIADQRWSNGRIGMWGRSYGALNQWAVAPLGSPYLTCMAAHVIMDDYYREVAYPGGAFQLGHGLLAFVVYATNIALVRGEASGYLFNNLRTYYHLPLIDLDLEVLGKRIPYWRDWLEHPMYDEYWRSLSFVGQAASIAVPIFQQGGWFDAYTSSMFRQLAAMRANGKTSVARNGQHVLIGPWPHGDDGRKQGDVDFGPEAQGQMNCALTQSLSSMQPGDDLRWFDHWLKDCDTGVMDDPPIRIFVMGANKWRYEQEWPLARARGIPYFLHSHGRANGHHGDGALSPEAPVEESPDTFDYDPANPVWTLGGINPFHSPRAEVPIISGPVDQRPSEGRDDVLVYTSASLEEDLEVTGPLEVILYAASSARDTDFAVRLIDVYPDGFAVNVSEGIIRARYRSGFDRFEFLEPGEPTEFHIEMYPTSNVFMKGHSIRLHITSSNFPRFSRNLNTAEDVATGTRMQVAHQMVLHSSRYPSHILLPIVPSA